jgi:hypothetical protein
MCLRRAPEKYIAGAALDRAALDNMGSSTSNSPKVLQGMLWDSFIFLHIHIFIYDHS